MTTWRLRTSLSLLLVATTAVTFILIGSLIIALRTPQINAEAMAAVQQTATDKARLLEFYLRTIEAQLKPVAALAQHAPPKAQKDYLSALIGSGEQFLAVHLVDVRGIIRSSAFPNTLNDGGPASTRTGSPFARQSASNAPSPHARNAA